MDEAKYDRIRQALSAVLDEHLGPNPHPPHMSATNIMVALLYRTGKGEAPPAQPCGVGACQRVEKYSFRCKARSLTLRKSGFRRRGPCFQDRGRLVAPLLCLPRYLLGFLACG
jgi:hypothetical protein